MSAREWKPGAVAMVKQFGGGERIAIVGEYSKSALCPPPHFVYMDGGYDTVRNKAPDARPLVVIDPEDLEEVERLVTAWGSVEAVAFDQTRLATVGGLRLQAALRDFADPTPAKPEEPTRVGAVVLDRHQETWTRTGNAPEGDWVSVDGSFCQWSDIDVMGLPVSEGVK